MAHAEHVKDPPPCVNTKGTVVSSGSPAEAGHPFGAVLSLLSIRTDLIPL